MRISYNHEPSPHFFSSITEQFLLQPIFAGMAIHQNWFEAALKLLLLLLFQCTVNI